MKIALGQINMYFEDKKTNYVMIEEFVSQAHDNHADLIIFPEMSCTGFSMNTELIGETNHETEKLMMELSRDYHIKIMFGQVLKNEKDFLIILLLLMVVKCSFHIIKFIHLLMKQIIIKKAIRLFLKK